MVTVIISHDVNNFASWKVAFEAHESVRAAAGIKFQSLYQSVENPNSVTAVLEFPSIEVLNGFMGNPDMKEIMEKSGVISQPEVKILHLV